MQHLQEVARQDMSRILLHVAKGASRREPVV